MTSSGSDVEFGIDTFGGITKGADGRPLHHAEVIRNIVEEGVLKAVAKGGSYRDNASELLADSLKLLDVSTAEPWLGFRCAR